MEKVANIGIQKSAKNIASSAQRNLTREDVRAKLVRYSIPKYVIAQSKESSVQTENADLSILLQQMMQLQKPQAKVIPTKTTIVRKIRQINQQ